MDTSGSPSRRRALRLDLVGALPIFIAGSLLHFAYEFLGAWPPAALIAAVNESVWEHLKIAFWPALAWALSQLFWKPAAGAAYWAARGWGLLTISLTILVVFYGYTAILGRNLLAIDIATFALAIVAGQAVSSVLEPAMERARSVRILGVVVLFAQILAFATFTYAPPALELFKDSRNGLYGRAAFEALSSHGDE